MREMRNEFEGWEFYQSSFDEATGTTVRVLEVPRCSYSSLYQNHPDASKEKHFSQRYPSTGATADAWETYNRDRESWEKEHPSLKNKWEARFGGYFRSSNAFSPVPEFIDLKITDQCNLGCPGCYQDSTSKGEHAPLSLIGKLFDGLDIAPYQIALGGGEPVLHPQLPEILRMIRQRGTVPNYTTSGMVPPSNELIRATNDYCGGIALSYHPHTGIEKFAQAFQHWKSVLRPGLQINTHVLMDKTGVDALDALLTAFQETEGLSPTDLKLVLLAGLTVAPGHQGQRQ